MFKKFRIGVRLAMGFGIILLFLVAVSATSIRSMGKMDESAMHIVKMNYARIETLSHLQVDITAVYQALSSIVMTEDAGKMQSELKGLQDARDDYAKRLKYLDEAQTHKEGRDMQARIKEEVEASKEINNSIIKLCLAGKHAEARALYLREGEPRHVRINKAVDDLVQFEQGRISTRYEESVATYKSNQTLLFVLSGITILVVIALSFFMTRGITSPLVKTLQVADRVSKGDLTASVTVDSQDEIGELGGAINRMVGSLKEMVGTVNQTASQVAASADQVNSGAASISRGAQTQASAAEETSSSMEQMAASIQTVAANSDVLASNVDETSASINQMVASIEQVARNTENMAGTVSETSATIEQMTATIDKVARDTENLSASVEETSATVEQMMASIEQAARNADILAGTVSETSSTIEEIAASIRQVAENVSAAEEISKQSAVDAGAGSEAVELTIEGINRISDTMGMVSGVIGNLGRRSEEIGKIVEVIEEIADQTNLLALNAAIEAARAGDAGRGFAVVADEVRKLAERSVVATKEIGEVIKQVQDDTAKAVRSTELGAAETKEGIKLADKAGMALKRIMESVGAANRLMSEVSSATRQQATAASQVMMSVENMNQATDQVTTAVREQAQGSKQIRIAVEKMNGISQQVASAMKEQAIGGRQIRVAVEDMNRVTSQVSIAAKEQATGSTQIMKAVENMNSMTQQVANATSEQKRGGELVVKAVENISDIARENLGAVQQLAKASENMTYQAESLQRAVSIFKTADININCWDILHCATEFRFKCPAYQNAEKRCWLINGTWCKGVQQGDARSKLANCMHCQAFKVMQGLNTSLPAATQRAIGTDSGQGA